MPAGPIISRPGPMLFRQAITDVTVTSVLNPSIMVSKNIEPMAINQYTQKYVRVFFITTSLTGLPSIVIVLTFLGLITAIISLFIAFYIIITRLTFTPPSVEPAEAPHIISATRINLDSCGHISKFAVAKPVVVIILETEK